MSQPSQPGRPLSAIFSMCFAAVLMFPLSNAAAKYLATDYHLVQIIWFRSAVHMALLLAVFAPRRGMVRLFTTTDLGGQLTRSLVQLVAVATYWLALAWLPITTATSIGLMAPLVLVALSVPLLGERVGPRRWLAVAIGLMGALIIIRPGGDVHWSAILVVVATVLYALFQIQTRRLAGRDDPRTTASYTMVVAFIVSTIGVPFFWITPAHVIDLLVFVGIGVAGALAHFALIKAFESGEASLVAPFDYGQLIGAAFFGYVIFAELPDLWTWVGASIIVASGIYVARREAVLKRLSMVHN
ncbi:MAG: DMT family transporter [Alphaproteobacteria bacterium]